MLRTLREWFGVYKYKDLNYNRMTNRLQTLLLALLVCAFAGTVRAVDEAPPESGPVDIMKSSEPKPGMTGTAWRSI